MDFYQYYSKRMEARSDKKLAIQACRDIAINLFDVGPIAWSVESGVAFLSALCDLNATSVDLMPVYEEVDEVLTAKLQEMRLGMMAERQMAIQSTGCGRPRQGRKIK